MYIYTCVYCGLICCEIIRTPGTMTTAVRSKPNPDNYNIYVEWDTERFAEGRFRYAIKGTWVKPKEKEGQKCVLKHMKSSCTWKKLTGTLLSEYTRKQKN